MSFPEQADAGAAAFKLNFKYFRRVEGTFRVSPRAKVESVQARIYEAVAEPRATNGESVGTMKQAEGRSTMFDKTRASRRTDRQPDRRDHAHRGQRHLQRRPARRRHGARQRRGAARPARHAGGVSDARIDGEVAGRARRGERHHQRPGARAPRRSNSRPARRVKGDVYYKSIEIHQGAVVEGRLVHHVVRSEGRGTQARLGQGKGEETDERSHRNAGPAGLQRQRGQQGQGADRRGRQPDLKLRVFVTGGGCSGFQYGFTFDEVKNEDDTVMEKNGVSC